MNFWFSEKPNSGQYNTLIAYSFDHFSKDYTLTLQIKSKKQVSSVDLVNYRHLTLSSLRSVWIFSILLPRHFRGFWQGEFVQQSGASLVSDHFLYSHDLNVWFKDDVVRRN